MLKRFFKKSNTPDNSGLHGASEGKNICSNKSPKPVAGAATIRPLQLFSVFFKIGLFSFGGGYAMIPMIERELSQKRRLLGADEILDIVALSESTPGPIAVNMATFVGSRCCGFLGALAATLGVVLPSFTVILLVSAVLRRFETIKAVKMAFFGVRAAVLALIIRALYTMLRQCPKSVFSLSVASLSFLAVAVFSQNALPVLAVSAILGIIGSALTAKKAAKERQKK